MRLGSTLQAAYDREQAAEAGRATRREDRDGDEGPSTSASHSNPQRSNQSRAQEEDDDEIQYVMTTTTQRAEKSPEVIYEKTVFRPRRHY